jgi:hypothetical protein
MWGSGYSMDGFEALSAAAKVSELYSLINFSKWSDAAAGEMR